MIYPSGRFIVVRNQESEEQSFHNISKEVDEIVAMEVIIERNRRLLAVAEHLKNERITQISIYDLKKEFKKIRSLQNPESDSEQIICIAWSSDTKFIASIGGAPNYTAVL